jgi:hypothetical protein
MSTLIAFLVGCISVITSWLGGFVPYHLEEKAPIFEASSSPEVVGDGSLCYENENYFIVSHALLDSVGTNFLIKTKKEPGQVFECLFTHESDDFEIFNEHAEYFFSLTPSQLFLDSGTSPNSRELIIYDLQSKKKVFVSSYAQPVVISTTTLTYWKPTNEVASGKHCPSFEKMKESWSGSFGVDTQMRLSLKDFSTKELGYRRCVPRQ